MTQPRHIVGKFTPAREGPQFICIRPSPVGPHVFVPELRMGNEFWPKPGHYYIVAISHLSGNGKAQRGHIVGCLKRIQEHLVEHLGKATWELAAHGRQQIVGRFLDTTYGQFEPVYDNGQRSNGQDVSPSIWFRLINPLYYGDALAYCEQHLVCLDEELIKRAQEAKPPAVPSLVAAKMSSETL